LIHESRYWKAPLLRGATYLERLVVTEERAEALLARAEREVFIGFYAIRKLLPSLKLSCATKQLASRVTWFPPRASQPVDYFHRTEIDELFSLEEPTHEARELGFLCNQVIHSYVFVHSLSEGNKLDGFFVSSDTMRSRRLYFFSLPVVLRAFRTVGRDYPSRGAFEFNEETQDWEHTRDEP
jgi:hypothetical protein